jgi:hypothetical protein
VRRLALVGAVLAVASVAAAETPAQLQARGEKLAKDGDYLDAIGAFKHADAREPTAERACLIALAYTRRNLYPQAELFLATCHARAANGALPSWLPPIEREIKDRLASGTFAAVTIVVKHGDGATLAVSAFAPDETFEPRTIYLPPGHHVITATAHDEKREREIDIAESKSRHITIDFGKPVAEPAPPIATTTTTTTTAPQPTPAPTPAPAQSHLARDLLIVGAGLAVAGAVVHVTWYRSELDELNASENPPDLNRYDAAASSYRASRIMAITLYGAGAAALIAGLVVLATHHDARDVMVSAAHVDGGAVVSVGWQR